MKTNSRPYETGPHGIRYAKDWRTVEDKNGITWSLNGYNPATNCALFASVGFANVITQHVECTAAALAERFDLRNLCRAFGWQGGTVWQVIDGLKLGEIETARA